METDSKKIWEPCLAYIENHLSAESFHTWLRPIHLVSAEGE